MVPWRSYYELAADNLGKIGITVELKPEEYGKYISTTALGKYEKMAMGPSTPFTEVDDFLYGRFYPELPTNQSRVADAELSKMLVAQRREMDPKKRKQIVDDIQRYLADKAYYVYVPQWPQYVAHPPSVKGFKHHDGYGLGMRLVYTWLDRWSTGSAGLSRRALLAGGAALAGAGLLRPRARLARPSPTSTSPRRSPPPDAIRRGEISSVELTHAACSTASRASIRSSTRSSRSRPTPPLARAKAADEARARGEWWGRFHGVPCTVKDTLETAGVRTTAGSPQYAEPRAGARCRRSSRGCARPGVVILGKTNVPPLAADWQSNNPIFGVSNNPWDLTRTPGGSTGGGAAALAAGLTFLEPGSDIGGSIRIPAHFCGVYGHKPTLNVIPQRGHIPPPPGVIVAAAGAARRRSARPERGGSAGGDGSAGRPRRR